MKRFTDTDKWTKNRWFRGLPVEYRLFWLFILDSCDMVGVYEVDIDFYNISQSCSIKIEDAIKHFGDRIRVINSGRKWWIVSFCRYQYGELKEDNIKNKPHQRYICELKNHRLWIDYKKTINSLEEKEKEKEMDKEQDKEQAIEVPENKKFSMMCMYDEMNFIAPLSQKLVNTPFQIELLPEYFDEFNDHLRLTAEPQKEYQDYRRHFINWITKRMQFAQSSNRNTDPNGKQIDRRLHPDFPSDYVYCDMNIYYHKQGKIESMRKDGNFSEYKQPNK